MAAMHHPSVYTTYLDGKDLTEMQAAATGLGLLTSGTIDEIRVRVDGKLLELHNALGK